MSHLQQSSTNVHSSQTPFLPWRRDVGEDASQRNRIYVPLDELEQFNIAEEEVSPDFCSAWFGLILQLAFGTSASSQLCGAGQAQAL